MHIGNHKVSSRDLLALAVPALVSAVAAYVIGRRENYPFLGMCLFFLALVAPAIWIWKRRLETNPDDPWKFKL